MVERSGRASCQHDREHKNATHLALLQVSLQVLDPPCHTYDSSAAHSRNHDMLYQSILGLACVLIPFSAALPADTPPHHLIDFGTLDSTPAACQSTCSAFTAQFNQTCISDLNCVCNDQVGAALSPCFSCIASVANSSLADRTANLVLSKWASACDNTGLTVATPSISPYAIPQSSGTTSATGSASPAVISASTTSGSASGSATASHSVVSDTTSSASASASASGKPNTADAPLQGSSAVKALVGALMALFLI
ncbi:hypothetical protein B0H11DRAFT_325663 [Mycena galericulata]|nr:hypothetical protein B0H11DRAFT_325663 [Mycena galericulata]